MKECGVDECASAVLARGLCNKHYQRWLTTGSTDRRTWSKDQLCPCGQRNAQYKTLNGEPFPEPLCQPCYRRVQRERIQPEPFVCAECGESFTSRFNRSNRTRYCSRECKEKARRVDGRGAEAALKSYYKKKYRLTLEQVADLRKGVCEICGTSSEPGRWGNLHIDHCHETGEVRGVLCSECNSAIGKFHDDPELLRKAIAYLER